MEAIGAMEAMVAIKAKHKHGVNAAIAAIATIATIACSTPSQREPAATSYTLTPLTTNTTASFRGVSVPSSATAWASGTRGTVLRTIDGGASWTARTVPDADSLDFRDIEAFDSLTAYVLSAGEDGRIYKTTDGGRTWNLQFRNQTKGAFFDCLAFWDAQHGMAMSDPVDGRFLLLRTDDGTNWRELPVASRPTAANGEAAFAASGTCLVATGRSRAFLATGGGTETHVFVTNDRGNTWQAVATPVVAGTASAGIFALAFSDARNGLAIGGDYQKPAEEAAAAVTNDGGRTWRATGKTSYVSGAAYGARGQMVAVGTRGTRISKDRGATWMTIDTLEYNAVQLAADGTGYAVGPRGRIAKLIRR